MLGEYRQAAHLPAFGVQVMLGKGHRGEAEVFGHLREFNNFFQHLLKPVSTRRDRAQAFALVHGGGNCRVKEKHELHEGLRKTVVALGASPVATRAFFLSQLSLPRGSRRTMTKYVNFLTYGANLEVSP